MRKTALLFCVALCAMMLFRASAFADEEKNGFTYVVLDDGTVSITGCSKTGEVVIPSKLAGRKVTNLASELFFGRVGITSVSIPATVTYFGAEKNDNYWDYVFSYCFDLKEILVDAKNPSFTSIDGVLYNKNGDRLINYPCAKEGKVYHVPADVSVLCCTSFASCSNLEKLYLDGKDTIWYTYTFFNTGNLTVYYLPDGYAETTALNAIEQGRVFEKDNTWNHFAVNQPKPTITTQPTSTKVNEGKKATFKLVATGAENYQWYCKAPGGAWTQVSKNGTSATYTLTTKAKYNGYQFRCKVNNSAGYVWSRTVTLTVNPKPVITTQPSDKTVNEGKKTSFKVVAADAESYQWYYRTSSFGTWTEISKNGASATYALTAKDKHNGYQFFCRVKNAAGHVNSDIVTLTVKPKPVITTQPANQSVKAGAKATFKIIASNADSYQWYYQKPSGSDWTAIGKNGTSASYSLTTAARHNGYKFRCEVKNAVGGVYSNIVTLTVK